MTASHPKRMRRRCPNAINDKTATDIIVNGFMSFAPALEKKHCKIEALRSKLRVMRSLPNSLNSSQNMETPLHEETGFPLLIHDTLALYRD
jgi:hypothetical protein